jgi:type IV secretory pathway TrbF-like protein
MSVSLSQLLDESFQIAWDYLERTGELGDAAAASRFLSDMIEIIIRHRQRNRLALSNRTIGAYQRYQTSGAAVLSWGTRSSA